MTLENVSIVFACGHVRPARIPVPDRYWCESCSEMMQVTEVREYTARCLAFGCGFESFHGGALILAQRSATAHAERTGDRVGVYYGRRRVTATGTSTGTGNGDPERESLF